MVSAAVGVAEEEAGTTGEGGVEMIEEMVAGEVEGSNKEGDLDIRDHLVAATQEREPPSDLGNRTRMFQAVVAAVDEDAMREGGPLRNQYRQTLPALFLLHVHLPPGGETDPHLDLAHHHLVDIGLVHLIDETHTGAGEVEDVEGVQAIEVDGRLTHGLQDLAPHVHHVDDDLSQNLAASHHLPSPVDLVGKIHLQDPDPDPDRFLRRDH